MNINIMYTNIYMYPCERRSQSLIRGPESVPMMPRDARLSDGYTPDRCSFSSLESSHNEGFRGSPETPRTSRQYYIEGFKGWPSIYSPLPPLSPPNKPPKRPTSNIVILYTAKSYSIFLLFTAIS